MPRRGRCVAVACACVVLALCLLTHRVTEAAPPEGPCRGVFAAAAWCDMGKSTDERIALLIGALPLADKIGMLGSAIDHPAGYSNATGVPSYQVLPRRGTLPARRLPCQQPSTRRRQPCRSEPCGRARKRGCQGLGEGQGGGEGREDAILSPALGGGEKRVRVREKAVRQT